MAELKKPSPGFKKSFVTLFFNNLGDLEKILYLISGFQKQGYDMENFYWMDPELNPSPEELKEILADGEYNLTKEEINLYIDKYERYRKSHIAKG